MNVFINIGSGSGGAVDLFYKEVNDAVNWKIYCFEPLNFDKLISGTSKYHNVECIEAAATISDGKLLMYLSLPDGIGSTMVLGKKTGAIDYKNAISVNGIDFIRWFKSNINPTDFVIVSINIEGGEYVLMPRLFEIMSQIDGLWLKLHHHKFNSQQRLKLLKVYKDFEKRISEYKTFIVCDLSKNIFKFKWMVDKIYDKQK